MKQTLTVFPVLLLAPLAALDAADKPDLSRKLLSATNETRLQLAEGMRRRLIEIAPVHLPVNPPGDCNHYGWPIATMVGDTIVVMHRRIPGHNPRGAGGPHEKMSYGIVLRSDDGGKTWSEPHDLRDCMLPEDRLRGGSVPLSHRFKFEKENKSTKGYKIHLHAIGTTRDGGVVAINNHGVFRSDDQGCTWKHFSRALRDDTFPHQIVNIGPNIIDHPEHGLLVFGNWFGTAAGPKKSDQLVVLQSRNGGEHWEVESHSAGFQQYEPAVLVHDGKFLFVTRNQTTGRDHQQMSWIPGEKPTVTATNMKNPRYVDTVDFSFNPVTKRFEVVRSERHRMQLWLWSIDPGDWLSGKWKRECRLLARHGAFYRDADGFHPASAVVDTKRGVQHIFIYSGHPNGPAGVFRITRALDTPKLAALLKPTNDPARKDALLYRKLPIPEPFLITRNKHTFGGDIRIGDLNGDGRCDFLVYRCNHGAPSGAHQGGMKPCFLGAFEMDGTVLWIVGEGGNHPSRPMSVAVHDMTGDGAADVICFWHRPSTKIKADWQSLADVVVQIRDGRSGKLLREAAPEEITQRRRKDPVGANWVHQRLLVANFRGTAQPRDIAVKLGDTYVAIDEHLKVLWTYRTNWLEYSHCPAYIPAVGDIDGDGRDELNGGYFVIDDDGKPLWEKRLGRNMDSVTITEWDDGNVRAICSGFGHVMDAKGEVILSLGEKEVPHGQEVRVANLRDDLPGPEMVLRNNGHTTDALLVSSATNKIVDRFQLNFSPTNVGMEPVYWRGPGKAALLYNGGWLWDLKRKQGRELPDLPPPGGNKVHRMGFYHAIPANLCADDREELVLWDPTARHIYIYTPKPLDESVYQGYVAGPRQYNPRLMD